MSIEFLDGIVRSQKGGGKLQGIPSLCSAHPWALKTALRGSSHVLVESTCNQVNQFGGYTHMTPPDFVSYIYDIAAENGFPREHLILGGDHLGPSPWQDLPEELAMAYAAELVQAYVRAGYSKIHLDASMKLADDDASLPLDPALAARRTALLAKAAEAVADRACAPRYVIGTEVPIPGGATSHEDGVSVTQVQDVQRTLDITHAAFVQAGLQSAWERVMAVVVQPGVEYGDDFVLDYDPAAASGLALFSETTPIVYEAHSTDYQTEDHLRKLVQDHFAILKVGPALTFAFREAVFALAMMENELHPPADRSHLIETLENAMLEQPVHWKKHYHGSPEELAFARKYSLSDRARYYWPAPAVQAALTKLLSNLAGLPIPLSLLSQYAPVVYQQVRSGVLRNGPTSVVESAIQAVLGVYQSACS